MVSMLSFTAAKCKALLHVGRESFAWRGQLSKLKNAHLERGARVNVNTRLDALARAR